MKTLKKIGVLSAGYVFAIAYALMGIILGLMLFLSLKTADAATLAQDLTYTFLSTLGGWVILIAPIFYAILGFLGGIIAALVYNYIIVKISGGIKLDIS